MDVSVILRIVFCSVIFTATIADPPATLRFVNLVYRHGARSPIRIYPKSKNTVDIWPQKSFGWLTPFGQRLHYQLGKFVRNRYGGFLSRTYLTHELKIWSSDMYRTYMSAYSHLDGLYDPPTGDAEWRPGVQWQPIPVTSIGLEHEDKFIRMSKSCPRMTELRTQNFQTKYAKQLNEDNKELFKQLENETGLENLNLDNFWPITDQFQCEQAQNISQPDWYNATVRSKLDRLKDIEFTLLSKGNELQKLRGGPLLKRWIETLQNKVSGTVKEKFHMYSGHDTTVAAILTSLGVYDEQQPYFASAVFLELHETKQGKYAVNLLYKKDNSDKEPLHLTVNVTGCMEDLCPLETFIQGTKNGVPDNWEEECGSIPVSTTHSSACDTNSATTNMMVNKWTVAVLLTYTVLKTALPAFVEI